MKHNSIRILLMLLMSVVWAKTLAYDIAVANDDGVTIYYNWAHFYGIRELSVTSGNYKGKVVIPSSVTYNGVTYSVTSIGYEAFRYCSALTSVTIPNSVTSIEYYAFSGCSGLKKVIVPDIAAWCGIEIDNGANPLCYAHHLYIDENTEITNLVIPNSVTSIGKYAFDGCSGLTSVTIPNSVTSIGDWAFRDCIGLPVEKSLIYADTYLVGAADENITKAIIKEGTKWIGGFAFRGCSGLTSVTIPNSVTSIDNYAFDGCSGLTSVTIPNSVTSIGDEAFRYCSGLTSVTIGNSVTRIGYKAFSGCSGLTSVTIPNSVTNIGAGAFSGCSGLKKVIVPDIAAWCGISFDVSNIEFSANPLYCAHHLYNDENTEITNLVIPNSVTSIGAAAFYGCSGLTSVTIPNSVMSIGSEAFRDCNSLQKLRE